MDRWRKFLTTQGAPRPGKVRNMTLANEIEKKRKEMNYPDSDEDLGFKDKIHFYVLSVNFFKFFYDTYGCD